MLLSVQHPPSLRFLLHLQSPRYPPTTVFSHLSILTPVKKSSIRACSSSEDVASVSRLTSKESSLVDSNSKQTPGSTEQVSKPGGHNIEMKRGDWICPKCAFMNFSRNMTCLECNEARPRRMLTGREWECPQCEFFNYGKNMACLRCDCKRPGESMISSPRPHTGETQKSSFESSISERLDRILGRSSPKSGPENNSAGGTSLGSGSRLNSLEYGHTTASQRRDPSYIPFVPMPPDMFGKSVGTNSVTKNSSDKEYPAISQSSNESGESNENMPSQKLREPKENMNGKELYDKSDRWSKKATEGKDVMDSSNEISNDDFPEIMPMRKGENRFVISKKKDRSLTSPQYKRRMAIEQASNSSFVPFVPFPPGYFAKKDKEPEAGSSVEKFSSKSSSSPVTDKATSAAGESTPHSDFDRLASDRLQFTEDSPLKSQAYSNDLSERSPSPGPDTSPVLRESSNEGFSDRSLEGSAVTEPDPLDMSEEAKAQRWFRRVAQIKDISELSNIPDEDFPEIMPMRKGVNRFVVSKRKTPLERRLTSQQFRRNLPIMSSEPDTAVKDE